MKRTTGKILPSLIKITVVLAAANGLTGCIVTLPPAVQAASFALDGISFAATGKTMTDHALSAMVEQDCAMSRALNGEAICSRDAQLAELNAIEKRLNSPNADVIAKSITPAGEDENFKRAASIQVVDSDGLDADEVLDDDITDLPTMDVAEGPMI